MVAMEPSDRPHLADVQTELLQMHADLVGCGHTPRYLQPIARAPVTRSPATLAPVLEHSPPAHEPSPTPPEYPAADGPIKTQAELCAWLSQHQGADRVSLRKAVVPLCGGHWPPTQHGQAVVAALAAHDWLPQRTQMSISQAVVSRVSHGGGTVTDGTIRLGRGGILILDELCDVTFERVVFEGEACATAIDGHCHAGNLSLL